MKKRKKISIICILITVLLFVIPIPRKSEKEGTARLSSIVPIYEIYIYDYVGETELPPGVQDEIVRKRGVEIQFFGMSVYERTYFTDVE